MLPMTSRARSIAAGAFSIATFLGLLASSPEAHATDKEAAACIESSDVGQAARDEGKLRTARNALRACSREACPALIRADCSRWLADLEMRVPQIIVRAKDSAGTAIFDVTVSLDGEQLVDRLDGRLIPVDPGEHLLRFVRADGASAELRTTLREGEKDRTIDVVLTHLATNDRAGTGPTRDAAPASHGGAFPIVPVLLAGVGIAGGVVFGVVASGAKSDVDDLRKTCAPGCASTDVDDVRTRLLIANVSLGVGVASLGAAAVLYFLGSSSSRTAFHLRPNNGGALGMLTQRF